MVCPTSPSLQLENFEFMVAVRRRLGIAISFSGMDPHGHWDLGMPTVAAGVMTGAGTGATIATR